MLLDIAQCLKIVLQTFKGGEGRLKDVLGSGESLIYPPLDRKRYPKDEGRK